MDDDMAQQCDDVFGEWNVGGVKESGRNCTFNLYALCTAKANGDEKIIVITRKVFEAAFFDSYNKHKFCSIFFSFEFVDGDQI